MQLIAYLTIPDSVIDIGSYAFYNCINLESINGGNSVVSIGEYAFYACTDLTHITIPESVNDIEEKAFFNSELKSIIIPESVKSIEKEAFSYTALTKVVFKGNIYEENFSDENSFFGNLRDIYLENGPGTYILKNWEIVWEYKGK